MTAVLYKAVSGKRLRRRLCPRGNTWYETSEGSRSRRRGRYGMLTEVGIEPDLEEQVGVDAGGRVVRAERN